MKVLTVLSGGEPVDYEETEAGIYVNATTPTIRYTAKISNMVSWSGAFTDIFVCELAQEIVTATTHNLDTVQLLEQKTQLMIRDAVKVGAIRAEVKIPLSQEIYNRAIGLARGQRTVGTTGNVSGEQGLDITGDINFREREAVAVCKRSLTELRDKLLKSYAWEFAKKTATLSASTKKAGWSNSYAMPSDCLRVLCVLNGDEPVEYEVSDGLILCNASGTITARYIKTITDLSQFDAVFKNVLCYELAQEVSSALTWNAEQITLLEQKKQLIIQDAYKSGIIREEIHIPLKDDEGEKYTSDFLAENNITQEDVDTFTSKVHLADMSLSEVIELFKRVKEIYEQGRREFEIWKQEKRQRALDKQNALRADLAKLKDIPDRVVKNHEDLIRHPYLFIEGTGEAISDATVSYWVAIQTPGRLLASMGENFRRIFEDGYTERRNNAQRHITRRKNSMEAKVQKLGITMADLWDGAITIDRTNYTWEQAISIYNGMKNEAHAKAILWGNFMKTVTNPSNLYTSEDDARAAINKILNLFALEENQKYREMADFILQDFDENYDRIREAQIKAFNKGMNRQENYSPMFRLRRQNAQGIMETLENITNTGNQMEYINKVADGFTQSRQNISEQRQQPVKLNAWSCWLRAVEEQEYMAALGSYQSDVAGALFMIGEKGDIKSEIERKLGTQYWQALKSIINDSINNNIMREENAIDRFSSVLMKGRSIAYVAYRFTSMLSQTSSYFLALPYTNNGHLVRTLWEAVSLGRQKKWEEFLARVYDKAPELEVTGGSDVDRQVYENIRNTSSQINNPNLRKAANTVRNFNAHGFEGSRTLDRWTKAIVFEAVFRSRLDDGYSEADAIRLAHRALYETQPGSNNREQPRIFRGSATSKLMWTQFMATLAPIVNMSIIDVSRNIGAHNWNSVKAIAWEALAVSLCTLWAQFTHDLITKRLPDNRELPDGTFNGWYKWIRNAILDGIGNSIPLFNRMIEAVQRIKGWQQTRTDNRASEPFVKIARAIEKLGDEDKNAEAFNNAAQGLALLTGMFPYAAIRDILRILNVSDN